MIDRADDAPLMGQVNAALGDMLTDGTPPNLARADGLTYVPAATARGSGHNQARALAGD